MIYAQCTFSSIAGLFLINSILKTLGITQVNQQEILCILSKIHYYYCSINQHFYEQETFNNSRMCRTANYGSWV